MLSIHTISNRIWLVCGILFLFAQAGCSNSDNSPQPSSAVNSNIGNNYSSVNSGPKTSSSNQLNSPLESAASGNQVARSETYQSEPNVINRGGQFSSNSENYSENQQMSAQSGSVPPVPQINNRETYGGDSGAVREMESLPNTPVMTDLESAIDRWSNTEAASYGMRATLVSLWRRKNPTVNYNPIGIDDLTGRIRARPVFANCQRARQLNRNMFHDEGIRTVGQLYDYLEPCGN